ncbi:helix-turn-helix domain-containing protein, partial [Kitasatospora sp. NPDC057542]|uniref:helix-turn-helix domain-containing protein n=1 Tax=Kitasatospora sp. NPDC057542 TaxID=3346162 RepID=UPI003698AD7D
MQRNRVAPAAAVPAPPTGRGRDAWREFGARLRHWRRRAGLTQAQLGAGIGYDHTAVSRIEHGARRVNPRVADRIDGLLGAGGELRAACQRAESAELRVLDAVSPALFRPPRPGGAPF